MSIRARRQVSAAPPSGRLTRYALIFALALSLAWPLAAAPAAWADVRADDVILGETVEARGLPAVACPNVTAQFAILVGEDGSVLFSRDADANSHIASITKVMTAIVALDSGLPLDTLVTVTPEAAAVGESSANLLAGDTLTLEAALTGLMVPSGNDAAIAIADTVGASLAQQGQSPNDAFVAAMNAKATEIGMTHSLFSNPHGLDIDEFDNEMYSTAQDVAVMCAYAMKNDTFRSIVAKPSAQIAVTRADGQVATLDLTSSDMLLGVYEGACGIKTGYTEAAGNSFAGACNRGGGDLISVVLGCPSDTARFDDTKILFNWVYDNRVSYKLAHSDRTATMEVDGARREVPVIAEVPFTAWPDKRVPATLADPDAAVEVFAPAGNVSQELVFDDLPGSVRAGDKVGTANFYQGGQLIATQDLLACENAAAPDFFQGIGIWWDRLWHGLAGEDLVAEPVVVNECPLIYDKSSTRGAQSVAALASGEEDGSDEPRDDQQADPTAGSGE